MHGIGEGMVNTACSLKYCILNGSVSLFEVEVDGRVTILNVTGKGIKSWDIVDAAPRGRKKRDDGKEGKDEKDEKAHSGLADPTQTQAPSTDMTQPLLTDTISSSDFATKDHPSSGSSTSSSSSSSSSSSASSSASTRLLKVFLEYGAENKFEFVIFSELEIQGSTVKLDVPTFRSVGVVSREKGFIGIEARTNVEVQFLKGGGFSTLDTSELPKVMWDKARDPIVLAYKFIDPRIFLQLEVTQHTEVNVLIAVVEEAHVVITQTEEGRVLTKLIANVRNTHQQFLRVALPKNCSVWSTTVGDAPVKPAQDGDMTMIPMQKTDSASAQQSTGKTGSTFRVEFVYFIDSKESMKNGGALNYELPKIDLPVNHLFVSLYLPTDYRYGEFEGLKERTNWSKSPPSIVSYSTGAPAYQPPPQQQAYGARGRVVPTHLMRRASISNASMLDDDDMPQLQVQQASDGQNRTKALGVLPVKIDIPTSGILYRFEQLLVSEGSELKISVDFRHQGKRRGRTCCTIL